MQTDTQQVVRVNSDNVLTSYYCGVGFEWDPSDDHDYTEEQWQTIFQRVAYSRVPIIRLMLRAASYVTGWDEAGNPIYDWESAHMHRVYRILDFCEEHRIDVIIGEWSRSPEIGITVSDNPVWAELIGGFLAYMLDVRRYTVLRYYNFINEPNGYWATEDGDRFAIWSRGLRNLEGIMRKRQLWGRIELLGPDSSNQDEWVDWSVHEHGPILSAYDVHRYVMDEDIRSGEMERQIRVKRSYIDEHDPEGASKPYLMTEAGIVEGKDELHDQQPRVKTFKYGVLMADFTIQSILGGQAGMIAWMLDDSMHRAPGYTRGSGELKTWGFWNTIGPVEEQALRPWYYPMSLLSRYMPRGCRTVRVDLGNRPLVRGAAAFADNGVTVAIVNEGSESMQLTLVMSGVHEIGTLAEYVYADPLRPADRDGFPVPARIHSDVNLDAGIKVTIPACSFVLLTSMSIAEEWMQ
ncbi:hypothetical protein [Paenibacillus sp. YAF4_2]|uniref:hypothetical protein n=1 Tax=Paenibacillus sp. YAF4_2 TaxID=3233085 RepID=UPI003F94F59B